MYFRHPLWIRRSTLVGRKSTCQYGTQQVKKDFMPWAPYITECLMGQFWCMTLQMKTHFRRCVVILLLSGSDGYSTRNINSQIIHWFLHLSWFCDKDYFHLYSPTSCPFMSSFTLSYSIFYVFPDFISIIVIFLSPPLTLSVECYCYPRRTSTYHCTLHCTTFSCSVYIYIYIYMLLTALNSDFSTICMLLNGL